jgi:imidazolonepropionase-like amidohydrolase
MRKRTLLWAALFGGIVAQAQETFPANGVADKRSGCYAFTNATLVKDAANTINNATLVIREGKIVAAGSGAAIPKDAVVIDCSGKFIYPSFIDLYTDYGIPTAPRAGGGGFNFNAPAQLTNNQKGAYGWNQAIKADVEAARLFTADEAKAKTLRETGFGTVLTHQKDGIARGTGTLVTLGNDKDNALIVKDKASAHYSFNRGTSTQNYPSSMMGSIALLRQSYLDANWYKNNAAKEGMNLSLQAWNNNQGIPQIFEATDKWTCLRADRIGDEFGVQYIIKAGGNEYQRIKEIAATKAAYILSLNYPQAMDVEDPNDARVVSLADMKNWEMAPANAAMFEKNNITFCLTTADMRSPNQFMANLRKAIDYGLSETAAMNALTKNPAILLGVYNQVGSLDAGKMANFLITSGPIFAEKTTVLHNWVNGEKYAVKDEGWYNVAGTYNLVVNGTTGTNTYVLDVKSNNSASVVAKDTLNTKLSFDGKMVKLSYAPKPARARPQAPPAGAGSDSIRPQPRPGGMPGGFGGRGGGAALPEALPANATRLSGVSNGNVWQGSGTDSSGNWLTWTATFMKAAEVKADSVKKKDPIKMGELTYPLGNYGVAELPKAETILIKNATVWTSDAAGVLTNTDVLVKNGKIAAIGKNLADPAARTIDATGKHVSPGIIDEHSHIAAASINEGGQSITSEVRIADNLNPDDINIYRQLSGGVTSSHILHGSANTIGGQTQLIKLRWGANDDQLKFAGADGFIKFALGENVKRTTLQSNNRFPDTRMGVQQVLTDAFQRATDYQNAVKAAAASSKNNPWATVRRDLELEALVEIMNKQRFITCHSYVASEITSTMRVAEQFNFKINTFTHILEGYKVADKMKAHGAAASTFSDWYGYKTEVQDAIAYNAAIMQKMGLNVAINSDDAEMARRLNQEAAKAVKYGGVSEEEALKMVTINPAKMLHVDKQVGSLAVGKDADLVIWSDNPLSIYAKALTTLVDGAVYFDRDKDAQMRKQIAAERTRLIQKMVGEKRSGGPVGPAIPAFNLLMGCNDHEHYHGLLDLED